MKIKKLTIYGYGKFEDKEIVLSNNPVQVFYGQNEAGKSTIMSFIHSVLFGFPTKQQSEKRYEPKRSGKYGGALTVESNEGKIYIIERIAGKAKGDLTIYNEEGEIESDQVLDELLKGIDKSTFQSIFSFDLKGLQKIFELNRDDLGKYLFLSTVFGSDAFYSMEERMEKVMEQLYKPSGRKPLLNTLLTDLRKKREHLVQAKAKEEEYERLKETQNDLNKEIEQLSNEKIRLQASIKQIGKLQTAWPLLKQKMECEERLESFSDVLDFPENGKEKMERLHEQLTIHEQTLQTLTNQVKRYEQELEGVPRQTIQEDYEKVTRLKEQESLIRQYLEDISSLSLQESQLTEDIHEQLMYLFGEKSEDIIRQLDLSMIMKEQVKDVVKQHEQLMTKKQWLDEQFERGKEALEEAEQHYHESETLLMDDAKREHLKREQERLVEQTERERNSRHMEEELHRVMAEQQKREQFVQRMKRRFYILLVASGIVSIGLMLGLIMMGYGPISFFALLLNGLPFIFKPVKDPVLLSLKRRKQELQEILQAKGEMNWIDLENKLREIEKELAKDEHLLKQLEFARLNVRQKEQAYDRIVTQFEAWEREYHTIREQLIPIYNALNIPSHLRAELLLERYEKMLECQQMLKERERIEQKKSFFAAKVDAYENEINSYAQSFQMHANHWDILLKELYERVENAYSCEVELQKLKKQINEVHTLYDPIHSEVKRLLKEANVDSVEVFIQKANRALEKKELLKRLQWINDQLQVKGISIADNENLIGNRNLELEESQLEETYKQLEEKENKAREELASIRTQIKAIEQSGLYSQLKHEWEMSRTHAKEVARKWAVYAVSQDLLRKTIEYHREHRLPELLTKAGSYFHFLTDGEYEKIVSSKTDASLLVMRKDGILFQVNELSQGTAEQLYVALRFSLAEQMSRRTKLPMVVDDSFVNFDARRFERTMELVRTMAQNVQVLFFTCHEHMVRSFSDEQIYRLTKEKQFEMKRGS